MSILPDVSQRDLNKNIENDLAGQLAEKVGKTSQSVAWPQGELYGAIYPPPLAFLPRWCIGFL